jgi:NADPH-dependent curcumin reductase CurA
MASTDSRFVKGDVVVSFSTWEEYSIVSTKAEGLAGTVKIPNSRSSPVPLSYYLGVLGMPGLTAYVGLHKICEPLTAGQTLYVSAASGAVGQVVGKKEKNLKGLKLWEDFHPNYCNFLVHCVGQYGKSLGLRVVGSAGDDAKVAYLLNELKFDAAFNYKTEADLSVALKRTCPKGIDIYFENVGGAMLDAVLEVRNT